MIEIRSAVIFIGFFFIVQTPCLSQNLGFRQGVSILLAAKRKPLKKARFTCSACTSGRGLQGALRFWHRVFSPRHSPCPARRCRVLPKGRSGFLHCQRWRRCSQDRKSAAPPKALTVLFRFGVLALADDEDCLGPERTHVADVGLMYGFCWSMFQKLSSFIRSRISFIIAPM